MDWKGLAAQTRSLRLTLKTTLFNSASRSTSEIIWLAVLFAVLCAGMLSPLSSANGSVPNLADYINHLAAVIQAKTALLQGQFPLRTMPLEMDKLGYPLYQFYSPSSFTFMGLIYLFLTPDDPVAAMNMAIWAGLMCGAFSMYVLALWFIKSKPIALLTSIAYLFAPYMIILVNHLGSTQEILALGLLPLILYWTLQRYYCPNHTNLLKLSAALYLFFTLHLLTAVYASVLFFLLLLFMTCRHPKRISHLMSVMTCYGFAMLLAAWFFAPAIFLEKYLLISTTYVNAAHLTLYHPTLANLLFTAATITPDNKSALTSIHPSLGLPMVIAAGICLFASMNGLSTGNKRADYWLPSFLGLFFLIFLFIWSPINLWQWLPHSLLIAQYSWRLLGQAIWLGALLFAWALCCVFKGPFDLKQIIIGILLIILCVNPWFRRAEFWQTNMAAFLKKPYLIYNKDAFTINFNQYPQWVTKIDSMNADAENAIRFGTPYFVTPALIKLAKKPVMLIKGDISQQPALKNMQLSAFFNHVLTSQKTLSGGKFAWQVPLVLTKKIHVPQIQFSSPTPSAPKVLPVSQFILTGFLNPKEYIDLQHILPFCHLEKTKRVCQLYVPPSVKGIELPQLFFPQLLKITINGKPTDYHSVLNQNHLLVLVKPNAGEINTITMQFCGFSWANWVSLTAFGGWLLLFSFLMCKKMRDFVNQSAVH